jgi:hypothetical protein
MLHVTRKHQKHSASLIHRPKRQTCKIQGAAKFGLVAKTAALCPSDWQQSCLTCKPCRQLRFKEFILIGSVALWQIGSLTDTQPIVIHSIARGHSSYVPHSPDASGKSSRRVFRTGSNEVVVVRVQVFGTHGEYGELPGVESPLSNAAMSSLTAHLLSNSIEHPLHFGQY